MAIGFQLPSTIQNLIQLNFLTREMQEGLDSILAYRRLALPEIFPGRIGETMTKTRKGRKAPKVTPLSGTGSTTTSSLLDNGLSPSNWSIEQFVCTLAAYGDTIDLNLMQEQAQIADQFIANARNNGVQAAQSLERICRAKLFGAYLSGNTVVTGNVTNAIVTNGVNNSTTNVNVCDIRGFLVNLSNGAPLGVSSSNKLPIVITKASDNTTVTANVTGATAYTSYASGKSETDLCGVGHPDMIPGFLTIADNSGSYTPLQGDTVVAATAPAIFRPMNRLNSSLLVGSDILSLGIIEDAVAYLRDNGVPPMDDGTYHCILDNTSMRQLFADQDFKVLFAGRSQSTEYRDAEVIRLLGVTYVPTTEAYVHTLSAGSGSPTFSPLSTGLKVRRPIIAGAESIIQADFEGMETWLSMRGFDRNDSNLAMVDGVVQIVREPLDRLQQLISMSWTWIGDYAVPTDITADSTIIPTASSALYKRCVVIEHVG